MSNENSGSATGNPRNKVALKPGHSLMDWIRLGNSGQDLSGTNGAVLDVSPSQLAEHNTLTDCWLCIRGRVYNVSKYLDFHPGGVEELMKGAGKDATNLFNQVHPWVNFESLLKKCLVGRLVTPIDDDIFAAPQPGKSKAQGGGGAQDVHSIAGALNSIITLGNSIVPGVDKTAYTKTDWYQQKDYVTFVLYHKQGNPEVVVDCRKEKEVWTRVGSCGWAGWGCEAISWPPILSVTDTKVEVKFTKACPGLWRSVPSLQGGGPDCEKVTTKVVNVTKVLHNVFMIQLEVNENVYLHVPVGYHLQISSNIKGTMTERNYTPVEGLVGSDTERGLRLMVKNYPGGVMSPWLTSRKPNDLITVSTPLGCFPLPTRLKPDNNLLMFAAGSGITPMIKLINWALKERPQVYVKLIFFNKTEQDIIWRREFNQLSARNRCFSCEHVLSEGSTSWTGLRGWVTLQLVQSFVPDFSPNHKNDFYVCVCGPISFTQLTERYVMDLGYGSENYFCFRG